MFSTIESAIDFIKSKLQDFYNRRYEMTDLYQQARSNLQEAFAQGKFVEEAKQSYNEVLQALQDYTDLQGKLRVIAEAFNVETGLGVFPAAVWTAIYLAGGVSAVILTAELLYSYYQKLQVQQVRVNQIKEGLVPPESYSQETFFGKLTKGVEAISQVILIGTIGLIAWNAFKR